LKRLFPYLFFVGLIIPASAQHVEYIGVFGGFNLPFSIDAGIQKDPRYFSKLTFRHTPIGFQYSYDFVGYGFLTTPCFVSTGQQYIIKNTIGGEVGTRELRMNYLHVPAALKLHVMDLSFFRLSMVASVNLDYLLRGQETISHFNSKLRYPAGVTVPTGPGYEVTYDGVFVPEVANEVYVTKDKFKSLTFSASVGFRADFDFNENWSLNFDARGTFGIADPRSSDYINALKNPTGGPDINGNPGAPDLYGQRRDITASFYLGISRIVKFKKEFVPKHSPKMPKSDAPKPRNYSKKPGKGG